MSRSLRKIARRNLCAAGLGLLVACLPTAGLAWGYQGHEVIAALAWQYMTPRARSQAQALLARDADALTLPDFIHRASWADAYRKVQTNTGPWHYVDIPLSEADTFAHAGRAEAALCPYPNLNGPAASPNAPAGDCVADKILQFEAELKDKRTLMPERIMALKFLIHLVGDIHQPLHAIDDQDHGGNCVWIRTPADPVSLHGYWDTQLVQHVLNGRQTLAYALDLQRRITPAQVKAWSGNDLMAWGAQSAVLAHDVAYHIDLRPLPTCQHDNRLRPLTLPRGYDSTAEDVVRTQLEKAGVRLAMMLNTAFSG